MPKSNRVVWQVLSAKVKEKEQQKDIKTMTNTTNKLTPGDLYVLGFNRDFHATVDLALDFSDSNRIGVNAYNKFLIDFSASGYEVHQDKEKRLSVFLYGLAEEWGEFQGILKRIDRGDRNFKHSLDDMRLELGDFLAYLVLLADGFDPGISNKLNAKNAQEQQNPERIKFVEILSSKLSQTEGWFIREFSHPQPIDKQIRLLSRKVSIYLGELIQLPRPLLRAGIVRGKPHNASVE